jgi:hypothetical protein
MSSAGIRCTAAAAAAAAAAAVGCMLGAGPKAGADVAAEASVRGEYLGACIVDALCSHGWGTSCTVCSRVISESPTHWQCLYCHHGCSRSQNAVLLLPGSAWLRQAGPMHVGHDGGRERRREALHWPDPVHSIPHHDQHVSWQACSAGA